MAAFASDRRSGWVRVLVLILCALFIFATVATPPAYAVGETVALFGLAAVLSAATAALGFKLANNAEGQATLEKMVQDFTGASIAAGLVLTGSKVNGLINGMQYIKMAVHNGKTYLDERIFAWCQKWLAENGVYNASSIVVPDVPSLGESVSFVGGSLSDMVSYLASNGFESSVLGFNKIISEYNLTDSNTSGALITAKADLSGSYIADVRILYPPVPDSGIVASNGDAFRVSFDSSYSGAHYYQYSARFNQVYTGTFNNDWWELGFYSSATKARISNYSGFDVSSNNTGLSGTDTLGKDVIDLTLDQILERLKEWAQDWYDAGADSVTNAATGAKDLPLSVATGAATANPALEEDAPKVYFPTFGWSLPKLRSGETDTKTVDQGKENASSAETSVDVAENQTVIDSLVNWALGYISPDTGLFSKFPLCVPYDAYLLACSALGVGVVGSDSIFGASPDDLSSIVQTGDEQSEGFTPVITISNDLTIDGNTYPIDLTIDLTDWTPLIKFVRLAISITVIAELIGAEYKRIKGK